MHAHTHTFIEGTLLVTCFLCVVFIVPIVREYTIKCQYYMHWWLAYTIWTWNYNLTKIISLSLKFVFLVQVEYYRISDKQYNEGEISINVLHILGISFSLDQIIRVNIKCIISHTCDIFRMPITGRSDIFQGDFYRQIFFFFPI